MANVPQVFFHTSGFRIVERCSTSHPCLVLSLRRPHAIEGSCFSILRPVQFLHLFGLSGVVLDSALVDIFLSGPLQIIIILF